jgi:uncharacterized repeat protein (TIGR03837 family)
MRWDIFCKVIDNHGDIGVCWRLAAELAARGENVRLWVDDASALAWMAPEDSRGPAAGVQVLPWTSDWQPVQPGDVVVEAFGCELPGAFQAAMAARTQATGRQPAWINLEYLTAESFAERAHGLPSPVMAGPAKGLTKRFFYPGFTPRTGGLIREHDLARRQAAFDRQAWLRERGIALRDEQLVSLFCYEPAALPDLLRQLAQAPQRTRLLVTAGRASAAVHAALKAADAPSPGSLTIEHLPLMTQPEFDELLWACDFNLVRGEDSLVRALWAGKPFAWQLYPQHDEAHQGKLEAFLDFLAAPPALREFFRAWNAVTSDTRPGLPTLDAAGWSPCAQAARGRLFGQQDLVTQLLHTAMRDAAGPPGAAAAQSPST